MLSRLVVKNFQAIKRLDLSLGQITTLIGPSDTGKSSLVRALRWFFLNKAPCKDFIHWDESSCSVKGKLDGHTIVRESSTRGNNYRLDGKKFSAVARSFPEELAKLFATSEINFQCQHDSPLWLDSTPGKVSRALNEIIDLGLMDRVSSKASRQLRDAKAVASYTSDEHTKAKETKAELAWVRDCDEQLSKIEKLEQELNEIAKDRALLSDLIADVKSCTAIKKRWEKLIQAFEPLREKSDKLRDLAEKIGRLEFQTDHIREVSEQVVECRRRLTKAEAALGDHCPTCGRKYDGECTTLH